jgi:predicted membrane protein
MSWGRLFFGIIIVGVGVILLLGNADLVDAGRVFSIWWPSVLILAGVISFLANPRHWAVALIIAGAGVAFLLSRLDIVDLSDLVIPAALILIGLVVLFGRGVATREEAADTLNSFNVFSGSELSSRSSAFKGGSVTAVFGGAEIDLRQAGLAPGASLDVFTAFGGVEVRVPQDWHVSVRGLPLFGGIDNVTAKERLADDAPVLNISATVLFGGLEIKH